MATNIDERIAYAGSFKRGLAITIDIFIVLVLRVIAAQILGAIWLVRVLENFSLDFKHHFGSEIIESREHVEFILAHQAFKEVVVFYFIILLVGAAYHAYFNSSSWKATIGKRILGIMILDKNFDRIGSLRALSHYFLSLVPMIIISYFFAYQSYFGINLFHAFSANFLNIILAFIAALWINVHIFNRKKTAYDLICNTIFVEGKSIAKTPWQKLPKDEI